MDLSVKFSRMEQRINQLESLVALQDKTISELNTELFRQQQDIQRLQQRLETLAEQLEQLKKPESIAENEKPPHW